jgi:hypothetical protein
MNLLNLSGDASQDNIINPIASFASERFSS